LFNESKARSSGEYPYAAELASVYTAFGDHRPICDFALLAQPRGVLRLIVSEFMSVGLVGIGVGACRILNLS